MISTFNNKLIKFVNRRLLRTPGLEFLTKNLNSEIKKKRHIDFWLKKASKNASFKKFFFKQNSQDTILSDNISDYTFTANNEFLITSEMFDLLSKSGLLVIKNALPNSEREEIIKCFMELKNKEYISPWIDKPTQLWKGAESEVEKGLLNLSQFKYLKKYSNQASKAIYNRIVEPTNELHYLKNKRILNKNEEIPVKGNTVLHSDRFVPHFKIFYTPFKIEKECGPMQYAVGSHKINDDYTDFFLNSKFFDSTDQASKKLIKKLVSVTTDENTLYIAFTNGLHRREPFTKENTERCMMFIQYVEKFNKFNYLFNH